MIPPGVDLVDHGTPRLRHALGKTLHAIRQRRPALVFSSLGYVNLALLAARPLLPPNCRIVVREANMPSLSVPNAAHASLIRFGYRRLYRRADALICSSDAMRREFEADFGIPAERLHVIANPVDVSAIRGKALPYRSESGKIRLVAAGRLTRQKGFDRMIELMATLPDHVSLTLLGDGEDRDALTAQARSAGLGDRVAFRGFQRDGVSLYGEADAFVIPSRWEGMPNAALEALAAGLPVIATPQSGGLSEIAAEIGAGLTIARWGDAFAAACRAVEPRAADSPSLLPPRFYREQAIAAFNDLIHETCRTGYH